jgi:hypothetical protein
MKIENSRPQIHYSNVKIDNSSLQIDYSIVKMDHSELQIHYSNSKPITPPGQEGCPKGGVVVLEKVEPPPGLRLRRSHPSWPGVFFSFRRKPFS